MLDGLVIDRSRITHAQSKRATVLEMQARKAQRDLDFATLESILKEADAMLMKVVVGVPAEWGVDLNDPEWIDKLSQDKYEELARAAEPLNPGEKKH